jgi:cytochrome c-type biogenesis protein CcmE
MSHGDPSPEGPFTREGDAAAPRAAAPARAPGKRNIGLVIGLVMAASALAGFVLTGLGEGALYSKPVDEILANPGKYAGRPVRAEGNLVHGSIAHRESPCEWRFVIAKGRSEMPVRYPQCIVPDTFRDVPGMDVGVTVEGQVQADGSFLATTVLAKCPSKYEMKERQERGEQAPHAATGSAAPSF